VPQELSRPEYGDDIQASVTDLMLDGGDGEQYEC